MKIIVLVKEVPDTYGDRKLVPETGLADRAASEAVLDEIGERSLEVALTYKDAHPDTEVIVLSMAPESATATLRKGLAMGATSVVHVADDSLAGADLGLTAEVLAAAITKTGYDLVITGNLSTDGSGGVLPSMLAELLGVPLAGSLSSVEISETGVTGVRLTDAGTIDLTTALPAVIAITESMPDARYPNFKGIMAAKKKPVVSMTAADLGIDPADQNVARSIMLSVAEKPPRTAGTKIVDEGDAGQQLADFLISNKLA
ncbi:electron transfer flavoprotein subunit beta [Subtercola boreus]|uniref:Electron transfer flavoprotein subunit beta n=1 Tax=Subtercola boreus TaxID=120213 RepID=A0A3E0VN38_9MICO|nr:electron transfer flavoprotein subunit beta/FixA family protein [Subtercola boreus]RFA10833.1 electron transfer flavoprotein subunit beta [Subtercola boreus]TQL55586.1 electron transfer flavoprotein beta subunit [Subtercola boreus]